MTLQRKRSIRSGLGLLFGYVRSESGNFAAIMALLLVPLVGALSMGVEASNWFLLSRSTQNAADSAAVAAANNAVCSGGSTNQINSHYPCQWEGWANAQQYGFTNGTNNVTVSVTYPVTCPDTTSTCYQATVTKVVPIYLTAIVGFRGDTTLGSARAKTITSVALAENISAIIFPACLTTTGLDSGGTDGLALDGSPKSNMPGCTIASVGSNAAVDCNGNGVGGNPDIFATGTIAGKCSSGVKSGKQAASDYNDPYANDYQNIPCSVSGASSNCAAGSFTCNAFGGTLTAGACYSGNVTLTGNATLTPASPSVVYIKNGNLSFDNDALTSTNVTYVFTGTSPGGFTGGKKGSLNITAPTSGTWSGIAAYQDISQVNSSYLATPWSDTGGTPTIDMQGLLYLPRTDVNFGGGAGAAVGTPNCFVTIFHSYDINGTALAMNKTGCAAAGLSNLPTIQLARAALVQ